uniref:Uncharacterized protein n=1 Tax=Molossus molossus TaxID=27622 RepID=A0A7J8C8W2_MOLMO|nr:hypothetical protein HJG59_009918 [Molossus molossus]
MLLAAQWGDDCLLRAGCEEGGGSQGCGPGGCPCHPHSCGAVAACSSCAVAACVTWMCYSFLQVFLAPTSSEPVILGLLNLHLPLPSGLPVWDPRVWERGIWVGAAPPDLLLQPLWGASSLGPQWVDLGILTLSHLYALFFTCLPS